MNASVVERVGITEVQIDNLEEKMDDLRQDLRDMNTEITTELKAMRAESTRQHGELAGKVSELQKFKDRWINVIFGAFVVLTWLGAHLDNIIKLLK